MTTNQNIIELLENPIPENPLETIGAWKEHNKTTAQHFAELSKMKRPLLVELHRRMNLKFGYQWTKHKLIEDLLNFHKVFCDNKYLMSLE